MNKDQQALDILRIWKEAIQHENKLFKPAKEESILYRIKEVYEIDD